MAFGAASIRGFMQIPVRSTLSATVLKRGHAAGHVSEPSGISSCSAGQGALRKCPAQTFLGEDCAF